MQKKILVALWLFLLLCTALNAAAKTYSLEKASVYYKINPDDLVEAKEEITFNFNGDFTFAYRDIPKGEWQLGNVAVFDVSQGSKAPETKAAKFK